MMNNLKIIFAGTSEFAVPALKALVKHKYQIALVITAPDKPAGRKQAMRPSPVKQAAFGCNLPVSQPAKIADIKKEIAESRPDLLVLAAYGKIIPAHILTLPKFGCLNLHPSLLPEYRGPSPIQTAILDGKSKTGVTLILMDKQIDHGPIIAQTKISITADENYLSLEKKLAFKGAKLLIDTLPKYTSGKIKPKPQNEARAIHTKMLTRQDGKIDWRKSAKEIERKIRAFHPWPGAWTEINGKRVKIIRAKAVKRMGETTLPAIREGFLRLDEVQPAGKRRMSGEEFFRGCCSDSKFTCPSQ